MPSPPPTLPIPPLNNSHGAIGIVYFDRWACSSEASPSNTPPSDLIPLVVGRKSLVKRGPCARRVSRRRCRRVIELAGPGLHTRRASLSTSGMGARRLPKRSLETGLTTNVDGSRPVCQISADAYRMTREQIAIVEPKIKQTVRMRGH